MYYYFELYGHWSGPSMDWVGLGWVGSGWVEFFYILMGWIGLGQKVAKKNCFSKFHFFYCTVHTTRGGFLKLQLLLE